MEWWGKNHCQFRRFTFFRCQLIGSSTRALKWVNPIFWLPIRLGIDRIQIPMTTVAVYTQDFNLAILKPLCWVIHVYLTVWEILWALDCRNILCRMPWYSLECKIILLTNWASKAAPNPTPSIMLHSSDAGLVCNACSFFFLLHTLLYAFIRKFALTIQITLF